MSDELRPIKEHVIRALRGDERSLIESLLGEVWLKTYAPTGINSLMVEELNDGGMGSLRFIHPGMHENEKQRMSMQVAESQFLDEDGVPILVSINIDEAGRLYEFDIWKVDFSKVLKYPTV